MRDCRLDLWRENFQPPSGFISMRRSASAIARSLKERISDSKKARATMLNRNPWTEDTEMAVEEAKSLIAMLERKQQQVSTGL
jgi:hypothetical protein